MARLIDPASLERNAPRASGGISRVPDAPLADGAAKGAEALGKSIEDSATVLEHRRVIEQEKADTTRVEDAWNAYKERAQDITSGEKGVLRLYGGAAVNGDIVNTTKRNLEDARRSVLGTLVNDEQRRRFEQRAAQTNLVVQHQVLSHLDRESREYDKTTMLGSEAAALSAVAAAPTSAEVFTLTRDTLLRQGEDYMRRMGQDDPKTITAYKEALSDKLWEKRIHAMLYSNPQLAEAILRQNEKDIKNPEVKLKLQHQTREASMGMSVNVDSTRIFDELKFGDEKKPGAGVALNTSGLPSSRDVAAQLPKMLERIEPMATEKYGPDKNNPDRAAYVERMRAAIQTRVSQEVQQLNALQRQAQGVLLDFITGGPAGTKQRPTSFAQVQADPKMMEAWQAVDPSVKPHLEELLRKNLEQRDVGDVTFYRQMWDRIHLPAGDPNKIEFYQQITRPENTRRLSIPQINTLRMELDRAPGRSVGNLERLADHQVQQYFNLHLGSNPIYAATKITNPSAAIEWQMRWREEVSKKVDALHAANQSDKVRALFTLGTPESVLNENYLRTFMSAPRSPAEVLKQEAQAARQPRAAAQTEAPQHPADITTREQLDAWLKKLPPGVTEFTGADGQRRLVPGRQKGAATPEEIAAGAKPAVLQTGGTVSTEKTISFEADGKHYVIPSIVDGKSYTPDAAIRLWEQGKNKELGIFGSKADATKFAEDRSRQLDAAFGGEGRLMRGPSSPADGSVMDESGRLVSNPAAPATPAMPKLVTKMSRQAIEQAGPSWSEVAAAVTGDVSAAGRRAAQAGAVVRDAQQGASRAVFDTAKGAVVAVGEALTPPSDPEKAAGNFRSLLRAGQFTPQTEALIWDAITSGQLTGPELTIARQMLEQIRAGK